MAKNAPISLYQLRISLDQLEPEIWRRVVVPRDILLGDLHYVIQFVMGWDDMHLHEFEIGNKRYGPLLPDPFSDDESVDEDIVHLNGVAKPKARFMYTYDFGDDWQHEIHIERELESANGKREVRCIGGELACPPEDCGGAFGYPEMLAAIMDPEHEEHDDILEWIGEDFDPQRFDMAAVNRQLAKLTV